MSFDNSHIIISTLVKVELPNRTVRICDGGVLVLNGSVYQSEDPLYGTLAAGDSITEGVGEEAPAAAISFYPNSNAATEDLTHPSIQWSPVSIWVASVDGTTGLIIRPVPMFFGFVDVPTLRDSAEQRVVDMTLVSDTERFFIQNEGNRLSQENHQRVYPGELGLNNMTGVEYDVAWGTESRPSAQTSSGSGASRTFFGGVVETFSNDR